MGTVLIDGGLYRRPPATLVTNGDQGGLKAMWVSAAGILPLVEYPARIMTARLKINYSSTHAVQKQTTKRKRFTHERRRNVGAYGSLDIDLSGPIKGTPKPYNCVGTPSPASRDAANACEATSQISMQRLRIPITVLKSTASYVLKPPILALLHWEPVLF